MRITEAEKRTLLILAAQAIASRIAPGTNSSPFKAEITESLTSKCGAFVSLYLGQELRGCIGTFSEERALYKNVEAMAVSAATDDSRFSSILASELSLLELEISILTPRIRIYDPSEIIIGMHGIYIQDGQKRGTLLPQVAPAQGWNVEEFLGNCSKHKAGLDWEGWKTAQLYTYEAIVFRDCMPPL